MVESLLMNGRPRRVSCVERRWVSTGLLLTFCDPEPHDLAVDPCTREPCVELRAFSFLPDDVRTGCDKAEGQAVSSSGWGRLGPHLVPLPSLSRSTPPSSGAGPSTHGMMTPWALLSRQTCAVRPVWSPDLIRWGSKGTDRGEGRSASSTESIHPSSGTADARESVHLRASFSLPT